MLSRDGHLVFNQERLATRLDVSDSAEEVMQAVLNLANNQIAQGYETRIYLGGGNYTWASLKESEKAQWKADVAAFTERGRCGGPLAPEGQAVEGDEFEYEEEEYDDPGAPVFYGVLGRDRHGDPQLA
jgi:hypothetical protein